MGWLSGYTKRKKITIDNTNVDGVLSNFPLYVRISADTDIGADIDANGYNFRFTSSDGTTELDYERQIDSFDNTGSSCTCSFWVRVVSISASATTDIYLYYKSASPTDGEDAAGVWDSNYQAVFHMQESLSHPDVMADSTGNLDADTVSSTATPTRTTGKFDYGQDFSPMDWVNCDGASDADAHLEITGAITFETWAYCHNADGSQFDVMFSKGRCNTGQSDTSKSGYYMSARGGVRGAIGDSNTARALTAVDEATAEDGWHLYQARWDGTTGTDNFVVWVDGVEDVTSSNTDISALITQTNDFEIGRDSQRSSSTHSFDGLMQEIRISDTDRSDEWLKFQFHNIDASDNELTIGSEESNVDTASSFMFLAM